MDTDDLHLAGVVDPARYSDRAVVVVEVENLSTWSDFDIDRMKGELEGMLGMRCVLLGGARLARIEEPTDG